METRIVKIIDLQSGQQLGKDYAYKDRNRARRQVDKLDNAYGAYRFIARIIDKLKGRC